MITFIIIKIKSIDIETGITFSLVPETSQHSINVSLYCYELSISVHRKLLRPAVDMVNGRHGFTSKTMSARECQVERNRTLLYMWGGLGGDGLCGHNNY